MRKMAWVRWAGVALVATAGCVHRPVPDSRAQFASRIEPAAPIPAQYTPVVAKSGDKAPSPTPPASDKDQGKVALSLSEPIDWEQAKELAERFSPRLAEVRASVAIATAREQVAFANFLPTISGNYAFQGFASDTGFVGTPVGGRFPVLPVRGYGPGNQDFEVLDLQVQWTVFQFGKRLAVHDQAALQREIQGWQLQRARQSVRFEVSLAYSRLLQAQATRIVAEKAVLRAQAALRDVRNLAQAGVLTREDVLRADVFLADVQQALITASTDAQIAVAALNRVIGINVSNPTRVVDRSAELESYPTRLEDCLDQAVTTRPEFAVVRLAVAAAGRGRDATRADFLPTISTSGGGSVVEGAGIQGTREANAGIFLKWNQYEGGRRSAELRTSESQIQLALAQGQQVCDTIAFETHVAYRNIQDAIGRLKQARTAVSQAGETLRLVRTRYSRGDAKPTDIVDAETALIRAEQNFNSARYDLLIALSRMEFATGGAPQPSSSDAPRPPEVELIPSPRPLPP